jgi:hypothetical protein
MWTCNEFDPPGLGPGLQIRQTAKPWPVALFGHDR